MRKITDIEEKRLQIGYFLSRRKQDRFAVKTIYEQWCQWWKEDFQVDGVQLELYNNHLCLNATRAEQGEVQPDIVKYYDNILQGTVQWFREEHRDNMPRKWNACRLQQMLFTYRGKNYNKLKHILEYRNTGKEYYIVNRTNDKHPCKLGHYVLHKKAESKNKCCCSATYEQVLDYMNKNIK